MDSEVKNNEITKESLGIKKLKIFEMFAGYGGASFALKKAEIEHECIGYSEIDKFAIQCFEQNHYEECDCVDPIKVSPINYGNCKGINPHKLPDFDLLTGGFPCQSFSTAGKGLGEQDIRGTLFEDIIRIAEVKKPKYMLLENVRGLTFKNHKATFMKILSELKRIGYSVDWKVLNSKNFGVPQNRERVWFICFRDTEDFVQFQFPKEEKLEIFLKDILEDNVDEKYFLTEKQVKKLKEYLNIKKNPINEKIMNCVGTCFGRSGSSKEECESYARTNKALMLGNLKRYSTANRRMTFEEDGISWCLTGNNDVGVVAQRYRNKSGKGECYEVNMEGVSNSLTSVPNDNILFSKEIRKLTTTECFRLMGFLDDEINLEGLSNSQKYKLAGNGWDINLVSKIFEQMFCSQNQPLASGDKNG